jgi:hypothetical protein
LAELGILQVLLMVVILIFQQHLLWLEMEVVAVLKRVALGLVLVVVTAEMQAIKAAAAAVRAVIQVTAAMAAIKR